ncbi:hypothetical protein BT69DRAFT_1348396 [Atractiella rhizophila]|nr:hypothetical protein BT69DRAFT_1348396 [Atractiella rhizophila]
MSGIDDLFRALEQQLHSAWESLPPFITPEELNGHLHALWHSLPSPPSLPSVGSSYNSKKVEILFAEPSTAFRRPPAAADKGWSWKTIALLTFGVGVSASISFYALYPHLKYHLREKPARPLRDPSGDVRETMLIVGVEKGSVGEELARWFEKRGWVTICATAKVGEVEELERRGNGKRKVIVLEAADPTSIPPFLRSLTSALTLRFPLHANSTSSSTYSSTPLLLTCAINCLPLLHSSPNGLYPLESVTEDRLAPYTTALTTNILLTKSLLPFLRRPGTSQVDAEVNRSLITLMNSSTAALELPFLSLQTGMDHALLSVISSLRRELSTIPSSLNHPPIKLQTMYVGLTKPLRCSPPPSPGSRSLSPSTVGLALGGMNAGLEAMYAPGLMRRMGGGRRRRSEMREVVFELAEVVLGKRGRGKSYSIGEGATSHRLAGCLPSSVLDAFIRLQDQSSSLLSNPSLNFREQPTPRPTRKNIKASRTLNALGLKRGRKAGPESMRLQSASNSSSNISPVDSSELDAISSGESAEELGNSIGEERRKREQEAEGEGDGGLGSFVSEAGWRDESVLLQRERA